MNWLIVVFVIISIMQFAEGLTPSFAQEVIQVNQTTACFLNDTAGAHMWENCGAKDDYLKFALTPWEYITGGYFSLVIVSIFVLFTYIKYHKIVYPIMTGILFLPVSYFVFPAVFLSFAIVMAFVGVGILVWFIFVKQTKEY